MGELKRSKKINREHFRKYRPLLKIAPLAFAVITLTACSDEASEKLTIYPSVEACYAENPTLRDECYNAYELVKQEAINSAPKFASQSDCEIEFGVDGCQTAQAIDGGDQQYQRNSSMWFPLIAGYMFGRSIQGHKPLYAPQAGAGRGQFYDANGKSYGAAVPGKTVSVTKDDLRSSPKSTQTLKRGGFGQVVAKQQASSSRSYGG